MSSIYGVTPTVLNILNISLTVFGIIQLNKMVTKKELLFYVILFLLSAHAVIPVYISSIIDKENLPNREANINFINELAVKNTGKEFFTIKLF